MAAEVRTDTAQYSCKISGKTFQILSLHGFDGISELFRFSLTLWLDDPQVDVESMVRKDATIKVVWGSKNKEYRGIVASFSQIRAGKPGLGGVDQEYGEYTVEIVPTLWLLGHTRSCRIFQNMGADKIIKKVLDASPMAGKYDYKAGGCPDREFTVQYRETDLAFISRLMEEEGVFYYFTHTGGEKMVLGDTSGHYGASDPDQDVEYKTETGDLSSSQDYLSELTWAESAFPGKVKFKDFNYREPKQPLKVEDTAVKHTDLEIYDYHTERYRDDGRGRALAKILVKAHEARKKLISASGTWRSAQAGCKFSLSKAYRSDLDGSYVVVSASHTAVQNAEEGIDYTVRLEAAPAAVAFKPLPLTPMPAVHPQTATVVGPKGEKIYMDKNGRAKVQFHWDLEGKNDEDSSCWIRVAQPFAGLDEDTQKKHGFQWHPQIGDEVVVDFLEGDADNPIIVGSVYNYVNMQLIKPEELIRQMILTRYQHRLLMDDKNANITMNTGGGEVVTMTDKKKAEGKIQIATCGGEIIWMEDNQDDGGNIILIKTVDEHNVSLASKDDYNGIAITTHNHHHIGLSDAKDRIIINTQNGHVMVFDDPNKCIEIKSKEGHTVLLDDKEGRIVIQSKDHHSIEMKDGGGAYTQLTDSTGKSSIKLDGDGIYLTTTGKITMSATNELETTSKSVSITAVNGGSVTTGQDLTVTAGTSGTVTFGTSLVVIAGTDLNVSAGTTANLTALGGKLSLTGVGGADLTGATTVSITAGTTMSITAGATLTSTAGALYTITGTMVKIN